MQYQLYSVYDSKVGEWTGNIMHARTPGEAERNFAALVNDPNGNMVSQNPEDYSIHLVGTMDTEKGTVAPPKGDVPSLLVTAMELKQ